MIAYNNGDGYILYDNTTNKILFSNNNNFINTYGNCIDNCIGFYNDEIKEIKKYEPNKIQLTYIVTSFCNLRCKYCYESGKTISKNNNKMNVSKQLETFIKFQEKYPKKKFEITFFGGEPLLEIKNIQEFIIQLKLYCKNHSIDCPVFKIITNATLIDDSIAKFITDNFTAITFSLDGTKLIHNENRIDYNGNGSFLKTILGIKNINKYNKNTLTACELTVTNAYFKYYNNHLINEIYTLLKELNINHISFIPESNYIVKDDDIKYIEKIAKDIVNFWFDSIINDDIVINNNILKSFLLTILNIQYFKEIKCTSGNGYYAISGDGNVYPCQVSAFNTKKYLCNINQLDNILGFENNNIKYNNPICRKCECFNSCTIYCKSLMNNKMSDNRFVCIFNRKLFKYTILRYYKLCTSSAETKDCFVKNFKKKVLKQ